MKEYKIEEYIARLSSKASIPGGGAAAGFCGAQGAALSEMVVNLSIGKKNLVEYEEVHEKMLFSANRYKQRFLELMEEDARNFEPLAQAYSLPTRTDKEKEIKMEIMEESLVKATEAPIKILTLSVETMKLLAGLVDISSKMVISDVGVGIENIRAAAYSARLNILINVNLMKNRTMAQLYIEDMKEDIEYIDKLYTEISMKVNNLLGD
ncbi:MAG: cyclodeaminase/cyclohydrolase family protein [Filifactoraceae bacterium]